MTIGVVFAGSHSGDTTTSISVAENPDEYRGMPKQLVTDFCTDINKKPTVLQYFVRAVLMTLIFVNRRLQKKDCCCRYKIKFTGEDAIDERVVLQRNFIQVGRVLRRFF